MSKLASVSVALTPPPTRIPASATAVPDSAF
ncbi:hypothetical protein Pan14r_46110 [Crateriforma conspicua]|uniref:Uncharacterized protein n=1 Tax=Crateriforma conspicua TaxID=2527996 RepID=A0A5C5YGE9_9PLAN|nr:hypothetical protein Pan14r_46110 [Crateriforma conspicua]